jgi:hypothetical protein
MIVYQLDPQGYYVGPQLADANPRPDPLIEGDDYLIPAGCVTTVPPAIPSGQRARWVAGAWTLVPAAPEIPTPPPLTPEEELQLARESWQPYAKAFFDALEYFPADGFLHLLDKYTQAVEARRLADPYDPLVRWDQRVTIVLRVHPDMDYLVGEFDITPEQLDVIFIVAVMIENGATPAAIAAFLASLP